MVTMGVLVIMGGDTVGVSVLVGVSWGRVGLEMAVRLISLPVLVVELQAVVKKNSNVARRIDNDFCCSISTSIK
jgi:hypothetical protein